MMRLLVLGLGITLFLFFAFVGCGDDDASADYDAGTDADTDSDTDTGGVPIEYPEALNPLMDPSSLMTGPISPPPEDVYGDGIADDPPGPDPTLDDHFGGKDLGELGDDGEEDEEWDDEDQEEEL